MTFAPSVSAVASGLGLTSRLRLAAAGAVTALAFVAPAAHAVVVVSTVPSQLIPVTTAGIYANVVTGISATAPAGSPGWDVNPWGSTSLTIWAPTGGGIVSVGTAAAGLAVGTVVGASSTFTQQGTAATAASGWVFNGLNYFGFRFTNEAASTTHYGYGVISLGASFTDPARRLVSLYFESTPNASITISAVPEPGTWAMMLGGLALAGTVARRRKQAD